jgi:hypothetical protein
MHLVADDGADQQQMIRTDINLTYDFVIDVCDV